jgi:hypothetical protein
MGAITDRAAEYAAAIKAAGVPRATTDVREAKPSGVLVIPVPTWTGFLLGGNVTLSWQIVLLGAGTGDLATAAQLEELLLVVARAVEFEEARPGSYQLPNMSDPVPCYTLTFTEDIDITIQETP